MHKIAILGGSFNPPTLAHHQMCQCALRNGIDACWLVPASNHRFKEDLIDIDKRIDMCSLIEDKQIKVYSIDYDVFEGSSYNMTKYLINSYPHCQFSFVVGADILSEFHKWYEFEKFGELCEFIIFERKNHINDKNSKQNLKFIKNYTILKDEILDVSSTVARKMIKENSKDLNKVVCPEILNYIKTEGLYL